MIINSFFHLDSNSIIPNCGFQCPECIDEIRINLKAKNGIKEVSLSEKECKSLIEIRYDPDIIIIESLLTSFENLPSFYSGFFIPELIEV
ncbi:MAG: hypothetical protein A2V46_13070 [Bacteroidetes bacterium RBG_19FT_COMBO_42_7]|nr:MAG: hypothetical protein A2V46_13070 [Bacteroidetes bacterium RBG_19FT_COMBO_42_7]